MDLENREKEGEKDYEDKKTYCCGFNGTCYWYLCQESVYRQNQNVIIKISHG